MMPSETNEVIDLTITPVEPFATVDGITVSHFAIENPGFDLQDIPGGSELAIYYCATPGGETEFLALGEVDVVTADDYFSLTGIRKSVFASAITGNAQALPDRFAYVSFPFESNPGIPYAKFVMPEFVIKRTGEEYLIRMNVRKEEVSSRLDLTLRVQRLLDSLRATVKVQHKIAGKTIVDDKPEYFTNGVNRIKDAISTGELSKGVFSRDRKIFFEGVFSFPKAIKTLRNNYPDCTIIFTNYPGRNFIAATPERLFRLEGNTVLTEALAGSIKPGDNEPDQSIADDNLLHSEKDVNEHLIVRDYLLTRLKPVASSIEYEPNPGVKRLANVTHLRTGIKATLKEGITPLDLGRLLFPTPALCGEPMEVAAELINSVEKRKRDLYGGVTGFITNGGVSEFFVSIRCGFIDKNEATLYAGCGIVADSDPYSEYEETNLKFIPLTSLFTDENQP